MSVLRIVKGTTTTIEIEPIDDETEESIDLSANEFWFTVKKKFTDTDAEAVIQKVDADFTKTATKISVVLSATDTKIPAGHYYYGIQYKKPQGDIVEPRPARLVIESEVTISG